MRATFIDLIEQIEGEVDLHDTLYAQREAYYVVGMITGSDDFLAEDARTDILDEYPAEVARLVKAYESFSESDDVLAFALELREIKGAVAAKAA